MEISTWFHSVLLGFVQIQSVLWKRATGLYRQINVTGCKAGQPGHWSFSVDASYVVDDHSRLIKLASKLLQMSKLKIVEIGKPNHLSCFCIWCHTLPCGNAVHVA